MFGLSYLYSRLTSHINLTEKKNILQKIAKILRVQKKKYKESGKIIVCLLSNSTNVSTLVSILLFFLFFVP